MTLEFKDSCDASDYAVGAILEQKKTEKMESRYFTHDRELMIL